MTPLEWLFAFFVVVLAAMNHVLHRRLSVLLQTSPPEPDDRSPGWALRGARGRRGLATPVGAAFSHIANPRLFVLKKRYTP